MTSLTIIMILISLALGVIFFILFLWGVKDGQFDDLEEAKYQMFREPEEN